MRIVVVGGSGFIGARLVARLRREGHEVVTASRSTGVNTVTGDGLTQALADAAAVVDVLNPPPSGVVTSEEFFRASGRNIITAALAARVQHLIVLSVVGTDRLVEGDYFRGKLLQEDIATRSGIPCTILRATQFFEFMQTIAEAGSARGSVRVPDTLIQPAAADDVAAELVRIATEAPLQEVTELAGPEELPLVEVLRRVLSVTGIPRRIVADSEARYFGIRLGRRTLLPGAGTRIAPTRLENWLTGSGDAKLT